MKAKKIFVAIISIITLGLIVATAVVCGVYLQNHPQSMAGLEYYKNSDGTYTITGMKQEFNSLIIPDCVSEIDKGAFYDCDSLLTVVIPDSVTTIGSEAFYNCISLTSITIPDSVTYIGNNAFKWCYSLTSVTLPSSVEYIGEGAFLGCNSLDRVYFGGDKASWEDMTIGYLNEDLLDADVYFYSEIKMVGNYWRYANGVPTKW